MANTLLSVIVQDAYREANLTNINSELTQPMIDEGMRLLLRTIASVYGNEAGEKFISYPQGRNDVTNPGGFPQDIPADWFFPLNVRVPLNVTSAQHYYLHPNPQDGSRFAVVDENSSVLQVTIDANGRRIEGNPTYLFNVAGTYREWMFDAQSGVWNVISPLAITDPLPFPPEFDDLFVIALSMRLNPRYTTDMNAQSAQTLKDLLRKFKARYGQNISVGSELALLFLPGTRSQRGYWGYGQNYGDPTSAFNQGGPFRW